MSRRAHRAPVRSRLARTRRVRCSSWTRRQAASGRCSGIEQTPYTACLAEPRAQALHQLRRRIAAAAPLPSRERHRARSADSGCRAPEIEFHAAHRRRAVRAGAIFHSSTSAKRRRSLVTLASPRRTRVAGRHAMPQLEFQRLDARLPLAQELRTALDQRLERLLQIRDGLDFRLEIAALAKSLARHECSARGGLPRQCDIEIQNRGGAQTARQTGARQAQQFAHPRHAHGAQAFAADRDPRPCRQSATAPSAPASAPGSSMQDPLAGARHHSAARRRWAPSRCARAARARSTRHRCSACNARANRTTSRCL